MNPISTSTGLEDDIEALALVLPLRAFQDVLEEFPKPRPLISIRTLLEKLLDKNKNLTAITRNAVYCLLENNQTKTTVFEDCIDSFSGTNNPFYAEIKTIVQEIIGR